MTYLGVIQLFYWINRQKKLVLTYHNIIPDELFDYSPHLGVSHRESIFEKQIQLLRRRFVFVHEEKNMRRCLITFDDGYKNQLEIAARILTRYDLKGVFFISFQSVITGYALTIDKIMMWISYVPASEYKVLNNLIEVNDTNRNIVASMIYKQLIENYKLWNVIEEELNNAFSFENLSIDTELARLRFTPLELNDLEILAEDGHLVGAHSWSHRPLGSLPLEMQEEDFLACKSYSSKYCNSSIFSYPFGGIREVSPLTTQLCEKFGFSTAYMNISTSPAWVDVNTNYTLPRISLPNEKNKYLLDAKLSGLESFCKKIIKRKINDHYN